MKTRRKIRHVANHPHEHLKMFEMEGNYGRISDLELVVYVIDNAVALKKIVIDPRFQLPNSISNKKKLLKTEKSARSSAKLQVESPQGVELVIL